jgi:hypothetical protein
VRRRAGITQQRGEHRDRGRVLNALRETLPGPGAPRIVRAGLPDRGAILVAKGLPRGVTGRARPVRSTSRTWASRSSAWAAMANIATLAVVTSRTSVTVPVSGSWRARAVTRGPSVSGHDASGARPECRARACALASRVSARSI